jgi:hypothetical protein
MCFLGAFPGVSGSVGVTPTAVQMDSEKQYMTGR